MYRLFDRVNDEGEVIEQWLGVHGAIYPLPDLPHLTEEHIVALFDITEKQRESTYITHTQLPERINYGHTDPAEVMLDREKMTLGYGKRIVRPIMTTDGLELIDNDYLTPLADIADELEIFERHTDDGQIYFAVKMGLMLVGVIMPLNIIEEQFVENVEALATKSRAALKLKNEREKSKREAQRAAEAAMAALTGIKAGN